MLQQQQQKKKQTTSRLEIDKRYENANEAKRSRKHDESMARSKTESARTTTLLTVSEMRLCFFRIFTANSFPSFFISFAYVEQNWLRFTFVNWWMVETMVRLFSLV